MAILEVNHIQKSFGGTAVLKDISFSLEKGQVLSIIGSSGSGKTTLLRCLNFLETAESGTIRVNGKTLFDGENHKQLSDGEIRKNRLHFGLVFQDFNLFPNLNVLQNITLAPTMVLKESKAEAEQNAQKLLDQLQMNGREKQYPYQLSGGQKQRVAIARALAMNPRILCYDEPTSALDPNLRKEVEKMILDLKKSGLTQLIITHDLTFAKNVADQMLKVQPLSEA